MGKRKTTKRKKRKATAVRLQEEIAADLVAEESSPRPQWDRKDYDLREAHPLAMLTDNVKRLGEIDYRLASGGIRPETRREAMTEFESFLDRLQFQSCRLRLMLAEGYSTVEPTW